MAMTFVAKNAAENYGNSATSIQVQLTSVAAGNLIAVGVRWAGASTTCAVSDGTSSLTEFTGAAFDEDGGTTTLRGRVLYLLSSVASGTVTYTATLGASQNDLEIFAMAYSYSGTASTDGAGNRNGATSGTSLTSGNITTTGTDGVAFGLHWYAGFPISGTPQINSGNADQTQTNTDHGSIWSKTYTSGFTGQATSTLAGSDWWGASIVAFKAAGSSASASISASPSSSTSSSASPSVAGILLIERPVFDYFD
jgi:hypothetical protein